MYSASETRRPPAVRAGAPGAWKSSARHAPSISGDSSWWPCGPDALDLVCECAKGTYIRVLGEDIARKLGTLGHLTRLRRTWVEPFRDMPMVTLEAALAGAADRTDLLAADAALGHLPRAGVGSSQAVALRHGQAVDTDLTGVPVGRRVRLYEPSGAFMGLAEVLPDGRLQPRRLITSGVP